MAKNEIFKLPAVNVERLKGKVADIMTREGKILNAKVTAMTNVVYQTAHAKRPLISKEEQKSSGRTKRVSDPNASAGVPVDTGALQISIKKKVEDSGKKVVGTVYVDGNTSNPKSGESVQQYAKAMEYGTSRIAPRSFLRSAIHVNSDWIKKFWAQKM
jgi:hypothetical protein